MAKAARKGFVYKERDPNKLKEQAEQKGGSFDNPFKTGVDMFKPQGGENVIRIMPPTWPDAEHYGYPIWVHQGIGAEKSTYLCLEKMEQGESCPICKAAADALSDGEEDENKKLKAKARYVAWVVDRNEKKPIPRLWSLSWTQDRDIAVLCNDQRRGRTIWIDNPDVGFDVIFNKTGEMLKTKYIGYRLDSETTPLHDDQDRQDELLAFVEDNPAPDQLKYYSAEHLEKVVSGTAPAKDELDNAADDETVDDDGVIATASRGRRAEAEQPPRRISAQPEARGEAEDDEVGDEAGDDETNPPFVEDVPAQRRRREPEEAAAPTERRRREPEEAAPRRRREPEEDAAPARRQRR